MTQKVDGFLASDGKFFEDEAECQRHEFAQTLIGLCDSHGINSENFFTLLKEWNVFIRGYYYADDNCKEHAVTTTGRVAFADDIPHDDEHHPDRTVGDKDAPAFLEQSFGRRL